MDPVVPDLIRNYLDAPTGKKPSVVTQLSAWHKTNRHGDEFGVIIRDGWLLSKIMEQRNDARSRRKMAPVSLKALPSLVPHTRMRPNRVKIGRSWELQYGRAQGTFMTEVEDHRIFLLTWGVHGAGGEMAIGTHEAFEALFKRLDNANKPVTSAPHHGVWDVEEHERSPIFVRRKFDTESSLRFASHPMFTPLKDDAEAFFDNIDWHTRHNQPGMRKVLLTGPPGTGKTSIAFALAALKHQDHLILYAGDGFGLINGAQKAAERKRRTIIIAEEIDLLKSPSGQALNWLDGSATPRNPAGTYIVTTTNYPKSIDPRILKRPGRLDRILAVGALRPTFAGAVAMSFLGECGTGLDQRELGKALDRTTPAEIKEIVNLSLRSMEVGSSLTIEHISQTRTSLKRSLAAAGTSEDEDTEEREERFNRYGPRQDLDDCIPY